MAAGAAAAAAAVGQQGQQQQQLDSRGRGRGRGMQREQLYVVAGTDGTISKNGRLHVNTTFSFLSSYQFESCFV